MEEGYQSKEKRSVKCPFARSLSTHSLGFLVENRFGLTTITLLFSIITTLSLGVQGSFSGLVLGDLVGAVCLKKGE